MESINQIPIGKDKDRKNLFSAYVEIQDILMNPFTPLIHIIGFQNTHNTIKSLTLDGPHQKEFKNFKSYNLQSYEFYDSSSANQPLVYSQTSKGDKIRSQDFGFLKYSFFKSLVMFKPAITIIVFDWQNQTDTNYDWKTYEYQVLAEVKQHQDKCPGSRQSKIVLLIFLPMNDTTSVDEKITSLKRAVAQRGDDNIKTFFLLTSGFEGLKNISKKFVKNLNDLAFQYYREKKFYIKKKQKKLMKEQPENIRYSFKHGVYSSFTKQEYLKPVKYMKEAYTQLKMLIGNSGTKVSFDEKRENADLINIKILQMLISNQNYAGFLEQHRQHFYTFQTKMTLLRKEQRFEELKWRANQMRVMSQFLEMFPPADNVGQELFAGYYSLNTMLITIARKQEYQRLARERGDSMYDEKEMVSLNPRMQNLIGKDLHLQDVRDPLGSSQKLNQESKNILEKYKIYLESRTDHDSIILDYAQKSIHLYKGKARTLKGNSQSLYKRMIHLITFHISEFVLASQENSQSKTQKYRAQIARSLIQEGWTQEGLSLVEKAKSIVSENLEDFFSYEMEILNYDRIIKNTERHRRFISLVDKVKSIDFEEDDEKKPQNLIGLLVGPQIIWARARFQLKTIQVNRYNKLEVEIFSKLDQPIKISKIILRFNENTLNQELTGQFTIDKSNPIIFERELYIQKDNSIQRDNIQLVEILFEIEKNDTKENVKQNELSFLIKPYLKPQDELLDLNDGRRKPARIKEPIIFNIEPMPSKIKFNFEFDENKDQALMGDFYNMIITMEPEDISITDITLKIESVDTESAAVTDSYIDQQNLMASVMQDDPKSGNNSTNVSINSGSIPRSLNIQRENSATSFQKQSSLKNELPSLGSSSSLPPFNKPKSQLYKDVEIFQDMTFNGSIDDCEQQNDKLAEIDYINDENKLDVPTDCRKIRLALRCYSEANNTINILFRYSFTQNSDKEDQKQVMKQQFRKAIKVKSQSPFKIDWEVKNSDPYLQNLKLRNEQLQLAQLLSPNNEECWINIVLTSQSQQKILYLSNATVDILERQKVAKIQQVEIGFISDIRLQPGESYEMLLKIKALDDPENNQKLIRDIDQFAELQFSWYSQNTSSEIIFDATYSPPKIQCTLPSPALTIVNIPLQVKVVNEKDLQKINLYQSFGVNLEISNESENVIDGELSVDESDEFYIGGELKSYVTFMPYEKYQFSFNVIPLQIGRLSLPKFNIQEIIEQDRTVMLIKGFTKKCLVVK